MVRKKWFSFVLLAVFTVSTFVWPLTSFEVKAAAEVYTPPPRELLTSFGTPYTVGEISGSSRAFEITSDATVIHFKEAWNNVNARLDFMPAKDFTAQEAVEMTLKANLLTGSTASAQNIQPYFYVRNGWSNLSQKVTLSKDFLNGVETTVRVPLADLQAGSFTNVGYVHFQFTMAGKVNMDFTIKNLRLVKTNALPLETVDVWSIDKTRVSVSGASNGSSVDPLSTPDNLLVHFRNISNDLRTQISWSNRQDLTTYNALQANIKVSGLPETAKSTVQPTVYLNSGWGIGSGMVSLPREVLSGQETLIRLPLGDFLSGANSSFTLNSVSHLFFKLYGVPNGYPVDVQLKLSLVKDLASSGSTGTVVNPPVVSPTPLPEPTPAPAPTPTPTPAPVPVGNEMIIDANSTKVNYVDRGVLGGNSMNDKAWDYNFDLFKDVAGRDTPEGKNLNRPLWRLHMHDKGMPKNYWLYKQELGVANKTTGFKNDDGFYNPIIPRNESIFSWGIQNPVKDIQVQYPGDKPNGNYYELEWYDRAPIYQDKANRHAISYTKVPGATTQKHIIMNRDSGATPLPTHNVYTRFNFKLSSEKPFSVQNRALIGETSQFRLLLRPDRKLEVRVGYPSFNKVMVYDTAIDFDRWYNIEILADNTSKLWVDGVEVAQVALAALNTTPAGRSSDMKFGTLTEAWEGGELNSTSQINDSYKFKLDELEIRKAYAGTNPRHPLDQTFASKYIPEVVVAHSFDDNIMTLDDYAQMAEQMNVELLPQVPNPCETRYGCANDSWVGQFKDFYSVPGLTAMIQYMTMPADSDYQTKANEIKIAGWPLTNLKKQDGSGSFNYGNLRASRGRVQSYDVRYVELGNEPYYQEYLRNERGFADRFIDLCESIKTVKSDIRCILPAQSSSNFDYAKVVARIKERGKGHLVAGLAIHNYYDYYNQDRFGAYPLSTMAGPYWQGQTRYTSLKEVTRQYLPERVGDNNFVYFVNEYNSILNDFKNKQTDKYLDAAYAWSEIAYMLENGITGGSLFFWNSAAQGEGFVNGLIGDYNRVPKVNLNGKTFQAFANNFAWDGKMLPVGYDNKMSKDAITTKLAPKVTAIASLSADGRTLYVAVENRDSANQNYRLKFNGFVPKANASASVLDANALTDTHNNISYVQKSVTASSDFDYAFPGYSISFLKFERQ